MFGWEIKQKVGLHYGVDMNLKSRKPALVLPRQIAQYLIHKHAKLSFPHIGLLFDTDHGTIHHNVRKISAKCLDTDFEKKIEGIIT